MATQKPKTPSPFGVAALELDAEFGEFERLASELERLSLNNDRGLDRARAILGEIDECRVRMAACMQSFAQALDEARQRNEKSEQALASRAIAVQERQQAAEQLFTRFRSLGEMVKQVTAAVAQIRQPGSAGLSPEDQAVLVARLPEFNAQLGVLVDEARKLMEDAHAANMRSLERNADSLRQSLHAARHRLNLFGERFGSSDTLQ